MRHLSALLTGVALLPMATIASPLDGRAAARTGPHVPMTAGLVIGALGVLGWLMAGGDTDYGVLVTPMMLTGFGVGFAMPSRPTAQVAPPCAAGREPLGGAGARPRTRAMATAKWSATPCAVAMYSSSSAVRRS